eukprot:gnl/Ergobibamus_cyprinoides/2309.p1 GENE.gnl/Ergobibamus_cyprinoides/2309~~gnl/Ergobibamus_cyprinoides/2309.p1  ORF type:complete len:117 (+),score=36.07 gnl/Ergobibamus_cyprinoides/2309:192-542(+)
MRSILVIRAQEEDVEVTEAAMNHLAQIGTSTSLRYAISLVTAAGLVARRRGASEVEVADVVKVYSLLSDVKRSADAMTQYEQQFLYHVPDASGAVPGVAAPAGPLPDEEESDEAME